MKVINCGTDRKIGRKHTILTKSGQEHTVTFHDLPVKLVNA